MSPPIIKVSVLTTPPSLKLKLLPKPVVQVKAVSRFPASVSVLSPILLDRTGGNYTFSLDLNELIESLPPGGVTSVFGRTGDVTAQSGDYTFAQISSTPTTLSGYGILDAQPLDADLTAISGLVTATYGRSLLTLANATALAAEVDSFFLTPTEGNAAYQPLDSDLTAIAALTTTSYGRAFLALADAAAARTAIGAVIGTDVQAYDADVAALAANSTNGLWARTGAGTGSARTITGTANQITVTNGDGASGNPTLSIPSNAALPGAPTTTTAAVDDNSTKIATTAMVIGQAAAATPLGNAATAVVGTSTRFARADHVHPGREVLPVSRTYYVRTDGSDSNTGLVNSAGGAFLTGQKAINTVAGLDLNGQTCTIQFGSGTYTGSINAATAFVGGVPTLQGDTTTPSNVLLNVSSYAIRAANGAEINVAGFKITSTGDALLAENAGRLNVTGNMDYGACTNSHMHAKYAGLITVTANYSITGGGLYHWWSETAGGSIQVIGRTITLTGTPAFGVAFANATIVSQIVPISNTYSGSATGSRYTVTLNSVILSLGATLPGNSAGSTATGGQYN